MSRWMSLDSTMCRGFGKTKEEMKDYDCCAKFNKAVWAAFGGG